jgi:hypothetical protein
MKKRRVRYVLKNILSYTDILDFSVRKKKYQLMNIEEIEHNSDVIKDNVNNNPKYDLNVFMAKLT